MTANHASHDEPISERWQLEAPDVHLADALSAAAPTAPAVVLVPELTVVTLRLPAGPEAMGHLDGMAGSLNWPVMQRLPDWPAIRLMVPGGTPDIDLDSLHQLANETANVVGAGWNVVEVALTGGPHGINGERPHREEWAYAIEAAAGPEARSLLWAAEHLERLPDPHAQGFARELRKQRRMAYIELQVTLWANGGLSTHGVSCSLLPDDEVAALVASLALPADLDEAAAKAQLAAMPAEDRMPYWLNPLAA